MGRFCLKRKTFSHGLTRVHEMRELPSGRLLGRISLWAESGEVVPELIEEFLIESGLLADDWRDQVNLPQEPTKDNDGSQAGW